MTRKPRRYAALLRGVSPMNAKMADLQRAFAAAGFANVRTVLSSGNVVFDAPVTREAVLAARAEAAMQDEMGRTFPTIVRSLDALRAMLDSDPYATFRLATGSKRVITFLRSAPRAALVLPVEEAGARILAHQGLDVFTAYVRTPRGPVFMTLIERTLGKNVTTRTWETIERIIRA